MSLTDEDFMRAAMAQADLAAQQGEVPVGAVAVRSICSIFSGEA